MKNKNILKTAVGVLGLVLALGFVPAQTVRAEVTEEQRQVMEDVGMSEEEILEFEQEQAHEDELFQMVQASTTRRYWKTVNYYTYNADGTVERHTDYITDDTGRTLGHKQYEGNNLSCEYQNEYNADGNRSSTTTTYYNTNTGRASDISYYFYNANGDTTSYSGVHYNQDGSINYSYEGVYTYDTNGKKEKLDVYRDNELSYERKFIYRGDTLVKEETYGADGVLDSFMEYIYEGDNCTRINNYNRYEGTMQLSSYTKYTYDTYGNETQAERYSIAYDGTERFSLKIVHTYVYIDGNARTQSYFSYGNDNQIIYGYSYEYDANGNRTKAIDYTTGGEIESYRVYGEYNFPSDAIAGTQTYVRDNVYDKDDNLMFYQVYTYQLIVYETEEDNNPSLNGLAQAADGNWYYYVNGAIATNYTGLAYDANVGWWYVENGMINFGYNGLIQYGDAWWCVAGGQVCFGYTGLWYDPYVGWWYVENGAINFGYSGFIQYGDAWWCVAGGQVCFGYTGLWYDPYVGWWYVENGAINFGYNGLIQFGDAWWCVAGGAVIFDYTGLWCDPYVGWWYVENGTINFNYSGFIPYGDAWWCVAGGGVCFDYTGLWYDPNVGWWYVENGAINFGYTGPVEWNGTMFNVSGGAVVF